MSEKILTVLMTVKNGEPYLSEAVESILGQTYEDFSFLILDNASTDNTRTIINGYHDPRIHLVELPEDIGQTNALNKGLAMVDTEYVARMDADDISLSERLERQMSYLKKKPDVALLGTGALMIDEKGSYLNRVVYPMNHQDIINFFPMRNPFIHSSVAFRLSEVRARGGYDSSINYAQDYSLWIEMAKRNTLANLKDVLLKVRIHSGQTTFRFRRTERLIEALPIYGQILMIPGISEKSRIACMFRCGLILYKLGRKKQAVRFTLNLFNRNPAVCLLNKHIWNGLAMVAWYDVMPKVRYATKNII